MNDTLSLAELLGLVATFLTSLAAILGAGIALGRHAEFKEATEKRLTSLEEGAGEGITRAELDARFAEMRTLITGVDHRFTDLLKMMSTTGGR